MPSGLDLLLTPLKILASLIALWLGVYASLHELRRPEQDGRRSLTPQGWRVIWGLIVATVFVAGTEVIAFERDRRAGLRVAQKEAQRDSIASERAFRESRANRELAQYQREAQDSLLAALRSTERVANQLTGLQQELSHTRQEQQATARRQAATVEAVKVGGRFLVALSPMTRGIPGMNREIEAEPAAFLEIVERARRSGTSLPFDPTQAPRVWAAIRPRIPRSRETMVGPEMLVTRWWAADSAGNCARPDSVSGIRALTELPGMLRHDHTGDVHFMALQYTSGRFEIRGGRTLEDLRGGCMEVQVAWSRSKLTPTARWLV